MIASPNPSRVGSGRWWAPVALVLFMMPGGVVSLSGESGDKAPGAAEVTAVDTIVVFPKADGLQDWSDAQGLSSPAQAVAAERVLVVLDQATSTVWVLDRGSGEASHFGRRGEGPGEFRGLGRAMVYGDTIWVSGVGNSRISVWHDSELVAEQRMDRPSAHGEFLVVDDLGVLTPEPQTSPELLRLPAESNRVPPREQMGETPFPLDLLAYDGSRIAVFENSAARLVAFDPSSPAPSAGEARIPEAIVEEIDDRIRTFQADRGGGTPAQYGRDLQSMGEDAWLLTLVRPTEACVIGMVLSPDRDPVHIAVPCDESTRDHFPFTSITPDGDCFVAGHALGVSRWCP